MSFSKIVPVKKDCKTGRAPKPGLKKKAPKKPAPRRPIDHQA